MKILHINTYDKAGGAEQFAFDFVHQDFSKKKYLDKKNENIETKFIVKRKKTDSPKVEALPRPLSSHFLEKIDKGIYKLIKRTFFSDWSVLKKIHFTFENLQKNEFYQNADIIHLHNIHYDFFDLKDLIKIAKEKKIVWTMQDMWAITGGEAYTFENENYKKGIGKTPYQAVHPLLNPVIDRRQNYLEQKKQVYQELARLPKNSITFVPVSKWLENCFKESFVYNSDLQVQTIQNSVDTSIFSNQKQRAWNTPRILFYNSSNPYKGGTVFEKALELYSQKLEKENKEAGFELFLIGKSLPNQNTFKGKITQIDPISDRKKMNELYNQVDIMVFPSRAENFSLMVLEAMLTGVYVVGSAAGGIVEQLSENRGTLFENGNENDLLLQLESVLSRDIEDIRQNAYQTSDYVNANWSLEKIIERYIDLYKKII
jgi:glycosyltransferase involved in cell wall biosynthesis